MDIEELIEKLSELEMVHYLVGNSLEITGYVVQAKEEFRIANNYKAMKQSINRYEKEVHDE